MNANESNLARTVKLHTLKGCVGALIWVLIVLFLLVVGFSYRAMLFLDDHHADIALASVIVGAHFYLGIPMALLGVAYGLVLKRWPQGMEWLTLLLAFIPMVLLGLLFLWGFESEVRFLTSLNTGGCLPEVPVFT
jgi:hypothetical protein